MIRLEEKYLNIVRAVLKARLPDDIQAFIFGSRAGDNPKPYSDIDIALRRNDNQEIAFTTLLALQADFDESDLPYKVDITDINAADPDFKKAIESKPKYPIDF